MAPKGHWYTQEPQEIHLSWSIIAFLFSSDFTGEICDKVIKYFPKLAEYKHWYKEERKYLFNNTIVVASGEKKADAILAALRTGCIDTLIVDETTARAIIEKM